MPVQPTYPGVYIEEISSGVRTITGVSTSIAAFIGWAPKGPTDRAVLVTSFAEYVAAFDGLHADSYLGYAVQSFFVNGGQQAYIVRLVSSGTAKKGEVALPGEEGKSLSLEARSEGEWSKQYGVTSKKTASSRFQLAVHVKPKDGKPVTRVEVFDNLSLDKNDPRYVVSVLEGQSEFVRVKATSTPAIPNDKEEPAFLAGGADGDVLSPDGATSGAFMTALNVRREDGKGGLALLDAVDLFNLLCVPGLSAQEGTAPLEAYCVVRRAFLIVDAGKDASRTDIGGQVEAFGKVNNHAAVYFPWISAPDPLGTVPKDLPPSGFVAGIFARTDGSRGVWKAPAGTEASLVGALGVKSKLTDFQNGLLNPKAVNCIRNFPVYGTVLWGARTVGGADNSGDSDWKYVPVRRTALFIEETLFRALKWVVFEPNDEPLWAQIRLNVGAFMHDLFRQGAFQGSSPQEAYFVKCDKETTTQSDINKGIVNVVVGFAALKPAEFVVVTIQQLAGQIAT
ncbi:phage tail sheath subtilisin-like domain-containing protein [Pendulispora rubella]|uniref:Phage tail sheath subtilisin-like domain-containing protein n=1 Tax=Pendulispora rubella TaxID=2741070 RepID=A0ABZ2LKP3_9BACT